MEIISYAKGDKAKKVIKNINKKLGHTESFKSGSSDIKSDYQSVDERINEINNKMQPIVLNYLIDKSTLNVMTNLNKHNLKVDGLIKAKSYSHSYMEIKTFEDTTDIVDRTGVNISDGSVKCYSDGGYITLRTTPLKSPVKEIVVSISYVPIFESLLKNIPLSTDSLKTENVIIENASLVLEKEFGNYKTEGLYETKVIDLTDEAVDIKSITISKSLATGTSITPEISFSDNGEIFDEWITFNDTTDFVSVFKRFLKIRIKFNANVGNSILIIPMDSTDVDKFNINFVGTHVFDGSLRGKFSATYSPFNKVNATDLETGKTFVRFLINLYRYKSISAISVNYGSTFFLIECDGIFYNNNLEVVNIDTLNVASINKFGFNSLSGVGPKLKSKFGNNNIYIYAYKEADVNLTNSINFIGNPVLLTLKDDLMVKDLQSLSVNNTEKIPQNLDTTSIYSGYSVASSYSGNVTTSSSAFDRNLKTRWASKIGDTERYIGYKFYTPRVITSYGIAASSYASGSKWHMPSEWTLKARRSGSAVWETLDTRYVGNRYFSDTSIHEYSFSNTIAYEEYRLYCKPTAGISYVTIGEVYFYTKENFKAADYKIIYSIDKGETWKGKKEVNIKDLTSVKEGAYTLSEFNSLSTTIKNNIPDGPLRIGFYMEEYEEFETNRINEFSFMYKAGLSSPTVSKLEINASTKKEINKPTIHINRNDSTFVLVNKDEVSKIESTSNYLDVKIKMYDGHLLNAVSYSWI